MEGVCRVRWVDRVRRQRGAGGRGKGRTVDEGKPTEKVVYKAKVSRVDSFGMH